MTRKPSRASLLLTATLMVGGCSSGSSNTASVVDVELGTAQPTSSASTPTITQTPQEPSQGEQRAKVLGGIRPGMTSRELRAVLGDESESMSFDDVKRLWSNAGYHPEEELPFLLEFDQMLSFDCKERKGQETAWYVYLRDARVVLAKGSVCRSTEGITNFGFPPTCFVGAKTAALRNGFGRPTSARKDHLGRTFYFYLEQGFAIMSHGDDTIDVLDVFAPIPKDRAQRLVKLLMKSDQPVP